MIEVTAHAEGALLRVRAQPGARRNAVVGEQAGALKVCVTAPPEDGKANQALAEVLRDLLGVRRGQVELVGGAASRDKRFLVRGMTVEELTVQLQRRAQG